MSIARSGQITVTTAGTAVRGTTANGSLWRLTPHPDNSGVVYVGNDGAEDVASTTGMPLSSGDVIVVHLGNLDELWFDPTTSGDKVCWMRLE